MTLEFYKLILGYHYQSQTKFRNSQIDFANSTFNFWEPGQIKEITSSREVHPETKEVTVWKAYPSTFSTWDKVVVRRPNLKLKDFVALFPSLYNGVRIKSLFKFGITQADIDNKKGKILFGHERRSTRAFETRLKGKLSEQLRAKTLSDLKQAEEFNGRIDEQLEKKLVDAYVEEYGPLASPERNYVLLGGIFRPAEDQEEPEVTNYAKIPVIQYFFAE